MWIVLNSIRSLIFIDAKYQKLLRHNIFTRPNKHANSAIMFSLGYQSGPVGPAGSVCQCGPGGRGGQGGQIIQVIQVVQVI